jgi:hypothetical protein
MRKSSSRETVLTNLKSEISMLKITIKIIIKRKIDPGKLKFVKRPAGDTPVKARGFRTYIYTATGNVIKTDCHKALVENSFRRK